MTEVDYPPRYSAWQPVSGAGASAARVADLPPGGCLASHHHHHGNDVQCLLLSSHVCLIGVYIIHIFDVCQSPDVDLRTCPIQWCLFSSRNTFSAALYHSCLLISVYCLLVWPCFVIRFDFIRFAYNRFLYFIWIILLVLKHYINILLVKYFWFLANAYFFLFWLLCIFIYILLLASSYWILITENEILIDSNNQFPVFINNKCNSGNAIAGQYVLDSRFPLRKNNEKLYFSIFWVACLCGPML